MSLYLVRFADGGAVQCSGAEATLAYLRQGARLVDGDRAALLRLAEAEQERVRAALRDDDEERER